MNQKARRGPAAPSRIPRATLLSATVLSFLMACGSGPLDSPLGGNTGNTGGTTGQSTGGTTGTTTGVESPCAPTCSYVNSSYCQGLNILTCEQDASGCKTLSPTQTCPKACANSTTDSMNYTATCVACIPYNGSTCDDPQRQTCSTTYECIEAPRWSVTSFVAGQSCTGTTTDTCSGGISIPGPDPQLSNGTYSSNANGSLYLWHADPSGRGWTWGLSTSWPKQLMTGQTYQLCGTSNNCNNPVLTSSIKELGDTGLDNEYVASYALQSGTVTFSTLNLTFGGSVDGSIQAILVGNPNNGPVTATLDSDFHFTIPK